MAPGEDCLRCHDFGAAGTVFTASGDAPADVVVVVGDAALATNAAGNFFTQERIPFPAVPEVRRGGAVRRMSQPVASGACNGCHGAGAAPRITAP